MTKLYYTYDQLKKDLAYLKNTLIFVASDFDSTINLNTQDYRSFLSLIKRQNIKIIVVKKYNKEVE